MESNIEKSDVPIIAFFGTKGGVGKTTITSMFAEFVTYSKEKPNVLMIDFDVDHRGLTVIRTLGLGFSCKTVHEYMSQKDASLEKALDVSDTKRNPGGGKLFLIPSAHADSKFVFQVAAKINYSELVNIIIELIKEAIRRYDISCVVIDCGPVINPYTAAAAHIADHAFIIGQNEPISYESLSNYSYKIKEFFEGFNSSKMSIILNKVVGQVREGFSLFAVIPFTKEIIDISEGLENIDRLRISLFESHIHYLVSKVFRKEHSAFIPNKEVVLSEELKTLGDNVKGLYKQSRFRFLSLTAPLMTLFSLLILASVIIKLFYDQINNAVQLFPESVFTTVLWLSVPAFVLTLFPFKIYRSYKKDLKKIEREGGAYIVDMLATPKGRANLQKFRKWAALATK